MSRVLITGGAGFIGSNLADRLLKNNHFILVIDNFDPYYSRSIKMKNIECNIKNPNYKFIEADICDVKNLKKILEENEIEYVFHLAARPGVRASIENPKLYHEVNVSGTLNLLNACLGSDIKRIIHASSSSVYGEPEYLPIDEKHPTDPISPYGATKLAAEKYCSVFSRIHGLKIIVLRYFTVFGPRQRPDMAIAKFTNLMLHEKRPEIYGDGRQTRDFTYVDNIIDANILAMKTEIKWDVFNVGGGERISVNELIKLLDEACKTRIKPSYGRKKTGDVSHTWASIEKARELLKYEPKVDIKTGIKKYVEWVKGEIHEK